MGFKRDTKGTGNSFPSQAAGQALDSTTLIHVLISRARLIKIDASRRSPAKHLSGAALFNRISIRDMQNWKLTLTYDGTAFHGWQVQPGLVSIQGELQAALRRIVGESVLPQGSGRTDAGVHALGQVATFELQSPIPAANLQRALNRTLPAAIRVLQAIPVAEGFHARHSARAKTYEYRIFRGEICQPFLAPYVYHCLLKLDLALLEEAATQVIGEHDFTSLAAVDGDLTSRVGAAVGNIPASNLRTIYASTWERSKPDMLTYRVRGSGFLHHMVRNLVGTMLDISRGHFPAGSMPQILAARSRSAAGPTAPAKGLFLHSVEYDLSSESGPASPREGRLLG
jgi:tRNA pseudouridine38-40 synthase